MAVIEKIPASGLIQKFPGGGLVLTTSESVLKWSKARKRYERQGLLVQPEAIEKAEQECLNDAELRKRRREVEAEKREQRDEEFIRRFAAKIREIYPCCPKDRESIIAEHACKKYSGRVGRTAAAKDFDQEAVSLAVVAHIRHTLTEYDELLSKGFERHRARSLVNGKIGNILHNWAT